MKFRLRSVIGFIAALAALYYADKHLRRLENVESMVLSGQTGFSWIDTFLPKRIQQHADFRKLKETLHAAKTASDRITANYAIANFEVKQGRPASSAARQSLRAITAEGRDSPRTIDAWQTLLQLSKADGTDEETASLADSYLAVVLHLPTEPTKLGRLLEIWRTNIDLRREAQALVVLKQIAKEFSNSVDALAALEDLALKMRFSGHTEEAATFEVSIQKLRTKLSAQMDDREAQTKLLGFIQAKDPVKAETVLFSMTPGALPSIDYWGSYGQVASLYEAVGKIADAQRVIDHQSQVFTKEITPSEQRRALELTLAMFKLDTGKAKEALELVQGDVKDLYLQWKEHLQTRLWLDGVLDKKPENINSVTASRLPKPLSTQSDPTKQTWKREWQTVTSTNCLVSTRWQTGYDDKNLYFQFVCEEPEPEKMRAKHLKADAPVWEDECVEVFIGTHRSDQSYRQWLVNCKGTLTDVTQSRTHTMIPSGYILDLKWNSGATAAVGTNATGWYANLAIPRAALGVAPETPTFFLNVRRIRYATGANRTQSWTPNQVGNVTPANFGLISLEN